MDKMGTAKKHGKRASVDSSPESSEEKKQRLVWGVMSPEEMSRPGATLISLIFSAAHARALTPAEVMEQLDVSYSYFAALRNGAGGKNFANVGEELVERIAKFLGLPKVAVKLAAGQLRQEDFYYQGDGIHPSLGQALRYIEADPDYGALMPPILLKADTQLQLFVITLYEAATGKSVLPSKVRLDELLARFEELTQSEKGK